MPVMNGLEAVHRLRELPDFKNIVIIAISASISERKKQESLASGCNEFLAKPFQVEDLLDLIQTHLKLDWIYGEEIRDEKGEVVSHEVQSSRLELIVPPPQEELAALYKIAMIGQITKLRRHVNDIEATDPKFIPFVTKVRQLAKEFRIEEIQEFIQSYMDNGE
jgi:response regulator RpfG family c-di-GMP phosphodiesterase